MRVAAALTFVATLGIVSAVLADPAIRGADAKVRNQILNQSTNNVARVAPMRAAAPVAAVVPAQQQAPAVVNNAPATPAPNAMAQSENNQRRGYRSFSYQPTQSSRNGMSRRGTSIHLHNRAADKALGL
jgi:hypothetical protein